GSLTTVSHHVKTELIIWVYLIPALCHSDRHRLRACGALEGVSSDQNTSHGRFSRIYSCFRTFATVSPLVSTTSHSNQCSTFLPPFACSRSSLVSSCGTENSANRWVFPGLMKSISAVTSQTRYLDPSCLLSMMA